MSENNESRNNATVNDTTGLVIVFKIVVIMVFVYPLLHYSVINKSQEVNNSTNEQPENADDILINMTLESVQEIKKKKKAIIEQASCPISYLQVILLDLCKDLEMQQLQCTPEDFHNLEKHKLPKSSAKNNTTGEPRGTIVGCIAAGLLMTSLGAAFLELYKAKSQTPVKMRPPMSRKCSLADLTVLKHNRKELVRRESIMEIPETGTSSKQLGRKVSRPPLRLD